MKTLIASIALLFLSGISSAHANDAKIYFISPKDGETVTSPVHIKFGIKGMKVRPAGEDANDKTSGHHHLIIDGETVPEHQVVSSDATHLHYGKGQTETVVKLLPGKHKLTLQFADGAHRSYGPEMSSTIEITVTK